MDLMMLSPSVEPLPWVRPVASRYALPMCALLKVQANVPAKLWVMLQGIHLASLVARLRVATQSVHQENGHWAENAQPVLAAAVRLVLELLLRLYYAVLLVIL